MDPRLSRRLLLTGAAGVVVSGGALVAVRSGMMDDRGPGPVYETFDSRARGRKVTFGYATPPGQAREGLPVVLMLHGRGDDAHSPFDALRAHEYLAKYVSAGGIPFAVVTVDGGETYWHPRKSGDDSMGMLTDELLPRLAGKGFDISRLAVMGYSMGGFGALLLARQSSRGQFGPVVAAAASSPALFASAGATSAGSFDDPEDYDRWGALAHRPGVKGIPLSVSCGASDPFCAQTRRYRAACTVKPSGSIGPGGHTQPYWRSLLPDQFRFLGKQLTS